MIRYNSVPSVGGEGVVASTQGESNTLVLLTGYGGKGVP